MNSPLTQYIRHQAAEQARAYLQEPTPDIVKMLGGDEHSTRNLHRAYHESLLRTKIALVWAGGITERLESI